VKYPERSVLNSLIAALADPTIGICDSMSIIAFNRCAKRIFPALEVNEPLSISIRDPHLLDAVALVIANREIQERFYTRRSPPEQSYDVRIAPLDQGGVLLSLRDLSAAKALERMRVDFIANASHELRTPLTAILGFIDTLDTDTPLESAQRHLFLKVMREQAQRMKRLIDDLLSLSSIEVKAHLMPTTDVDLIVIVRETVQNLVRLCEQEHVTIQFEPLEPTYNVVGDRDELLRVVENLVENAIKYGGEGKRVEIELLRSQNTQSNHNEISLNIRDFGAGIPHEHLPRLTERFYRVDAAGSRAKGGTGLGLAIVKHIVQRHQGRLDIRSEVGKGSVFSVILPQKNA
jgi:two-component system, OmpR family, phosphate regulon sensor histidine kinase PhoR